MKKFDRLLSKRILMTLAAVAVIVWFYPHRNVSQFVYEQGRPWNYAQLIAPFDIPIHPDSLTIKAVRDTLDARFIPIYTYDATVVDTIISKLPESHRNYASRIAAYLRQAYATGVISAEDMEKVEAGKLPHIRILEKNILSEEPTSAYTTPRRIYRNIDTLITDEAFHEYFVESNLPTLLEPNIVYSETDSKRYYDNEYQILTADRGVILQGQAIINKGAIITPQDYTNLRTYEALLEQRAGTDGQSTFLNWLGQFIYVSILLGLLLMYCTIVEPRIFNKAKSLLFLLSLITVFFLISVGLSSFIPGGAYIVPITIVPILVLVFFDSRTAFYVAVVTVLLIAPITALHWNSFSWNYVHAHSVSTHLRSSPGVRNC